MTTPKKFFLFSSTLIVDAPPKTEKVKDFDSTKKFLSIYDTPETMTTNPKKLHRRTKNHPTKQMTESQS